MTAALLQPQRSRAMHLELMKVVELRRPAPPSAAMSVRPQPPDADAAVVRRMAAGDERALATLYDRWQTLVFSLALHVLGDRDEAEEVVEETFWQAWRQAARYAGHRGTVGTWLTMIARSRTLDRLRARTRARAAHQAAALADPVAFEGAVHPDPLHDAAAAETRAAVRRALQAIPPDQRRTLEMAYFGGMSQSEIAAATGEPLGTVKTRTRLGLQRLRGILAEAV
jgi:RNA polymerase sigma-70 factor (ECF subfamily)